MSSRETEMTLWYWNERGGTLIEEFMAVQRGPHHAQRLIDGLILLGGEKRRLARGERRVDIRDKEVVAIQTKNSRLGMYLMGQTLFTLHLLQSMGPRSVESIALLRLTMLDCARLPRLTRCKVVAVPPDLPTCRPSGGLRRPQTNHRTYGTFRTALRPDACGNRRRACGRPRAPASKRRRCASSAGAATA
jgi:hypothetical protein